MRIKVGRNPEDTEKLVTPGIVFCKTSKAGVSAYLVALGWWDFSVKLLWAIRN